jgi:integrase
MRVSGSANILFNERIPTDVKPQAAGRKLHIPVGAETVAYTVSPKAIAVRLSLRTADRREAKLRTAQVSAYLGGVWQALRDGAGVPLTHRQAVALAKVLYDSWAEERATSIERAIEFDRQTGAWLPAMSNTADENAGSFEALGLYLAGQEEAAERMMGPLVDRLLLGKGVAKLASASRPMVAHAFLQAMQDAAANQKREAAGDFTPDPKANRFPEWEEPTRVLSFDDLLRDWWVEAEKAGRSDATYAAYKLALERLAESVGHSDAARLTQADIVVFKDSRLRTKSVATVKQELAAIKSLCGWAVGNGKLTSNPADDIKQMVGKKTQTRSKGYTVEEAVAILKLTHEVKDTETRALAKRWLPWLCAYTGARVGEVAQLRKEDVRKEGDNWLMLITPEAGTVKDKKARTVVIHEHLVAIGFPDMVDKQPDGHMFISASSRAERNLTGTHVGQLARKAVSDKRIRPNHAWRHLFKTIGREVGIADSILDAICGHAAKTVGQAYGDVSVAAQASAMAKFPRFPVDLP